jgi:hypothetical protein|tara:strand:- start:1795 stop:2460 length:666 start_codon:yes stop_codon:yes gene_type:complete
VKKFLILLIVLVCCKNNENDSFDYRYDQIIAVYSIDEISVIIIEESFEPFKTSLIVYKNGNPVEKKYIDRMPYMANLDTIIVNNPRNIRKEIESISNSSSLMELHFKSVMLSSCVSKNNFTVDEINYVIGENGFITGLTVMTELDSVRDTKWLGSHTIELNLTIFNSYNHSISRLDSIYNGCRYYSDYSFTEIAFNEMIGAVIKSVSSNVPRTSHWDTSRP